jgi:hypothetical protein
MKQSKTLLAALALSSPMVVVAQPGIPLPALEFACHVLTADAATGIVLVQADNPERAGIVASSAEVVLPAGGRRPVADVVQCIQLGSQQRFSDPLATQLLRDTAL